jgi:DeoR/GlpR family transcriptional regulator of sugar metabolism
MPPASLKYRSAPARHAAILDMLSADGAYLSQAELSKCLDVSEMTIRRDARLLESRRLLRVVSGGVCLIREPVPENAFPLRTQRDTEAKRRIAAAALSLLAPNSTVALDAGSTVLEFAREFTPRHVLTVVTASLPVMCLLGNNPNVELIGLGGVLRPRTQAFAGPMTVDSLRQLRVQQTFLGATAVNSDGTYEGNTWDFEVKRALIEIADEVVLLADSKKFERTAIVRVGPLSDVDLAVVDERIAPSAVEILKSAGIRVVIAGDTAETGASDLPTRKEQME